MGCSCASQLKMNMGATRSLRFSPDGAFLAAAEAADFVPLSEITMGDDEEKSKADRLREAERWMTVGGGSAVCSSCRYEYDPEQGDPEHPVAPGVKFKDLPEDWGCPICGAGANKFRAADKVVAGFAENQTYGLGTNSWTEGQKLTIIYGTIALFIFIFLSGYLLG